MYSAFFPECLRSITNKAWIVSHKGVGCIIYNINRNRGLIILYTVITFNQLKLIRMNQ
jgi:UDP-N-acetylglucosamine transferase subunit ALG13